MHMLRRLTIAPSLVAASLVAAGLVAASLAAVLPLPARAQTAAPVPPLLGIAHIAIRVHDIAASVAFYNKLGFEQAFAMTAKDGTTVSQSFIKLDDRQFIELYPVTTSNPKIGFLHLCFEGEDLNAIHDRYVADGLTPITVRKAGAGNLLFTLKGPQQFADPQNIEYTQYMPGSLHSNDFGKHLGADRIATKMTVVTLAMKDPAAARTFYLTKLGFTASPTSPTALDLPGPSGEQIDIVPLTPLGAASSITLETASMVAATKRLTGQHIAFTNSEPGKIPGRPNSKMRVNPPMPPTLTIVDPDGNQIHIVGHTEP
jgi:catechol 2,3-dioxygenase-like lactoylglutathione lyase family enzyme